MFDRLDEAVVIVDTSGLIVFSNPAVQRLLGWNAAELAGRQLLTIIPDRLRNAHSVAFERYRASGHSQLFGHPLRLAALHHDGSEIAIELLLSTGPTPGTTVGLLRDVSARVDIGGHAVLTERLLRVVADRRGDGVDQERVLQALGQSLSWDVAVLWVPERARRSLQCAAFWSGDSVNVEQFRPAAEGSLLPLGVGVPGRAWETGQAVWTDLRDHSTSPVEDAATAAGFTTAFAVPVVAGGSFVGVIELLDANPREADSNLLEAMLSTGRLVGEFLERLWHEEERLRLLTRVETERARLEAVQRRMPSAVLVADAPSGRIIAGNDKLDELLGPPALADADGEAHLEYRFRQPNGTDYPFEELPFARAARTGEIIDNAEYEFLAPNGLCHFLAVSAAPVIDRDGQVVSSIATFHDVSDRRRAADRDRLLSQASAAMTRSLDYEAGLVEVARLAVGLLGEAVAIHVVRGGGTLEAVVPASHDAVSGGAALLDSGWPSDASVLSAVGDAVADGQLSLRQHGLRSPGDVATRHQVMSGGSPVRSAMFVPILAGSEVVAVLSFVSVQATSPFDEGAVALGEELARRCSVAIVNARMYQRERAVAATLQASLVPPSLPAVPGLRLAARFHPGGDGLRVGGDFYDVFPVGTATAVMVGDVCGKGAEAAALSAQCRFTARALSDPSRDPGTVLRLIDARVRATRPVEEDRFCTAVLVLLERAEGGVVCTASSAGHPLPLVLRRHGSVEEIDCRGSLLFALSDPIYEVAKFDLAVGDTMVLFTDGVTEARVGTNLFGDGRLRSVLASCRGLSPDVIAARVADCAITHAGGHIADDMAVVVVSVEEP
jgi:PAS domain S-box-containing protein